MQNEVNYQRSASELEEHASMFWPVEISQKADKISVIPRLLQTQDDFIAILSVPVSDLYGLFNIVNASSLSGNLFLKHLMVLADVGGEFLQRVCGEFEATFPSRELEYVWNGRTHRYEFQMLPNSNPTNARLGVSGRSLGQSRELDELLQDVAAILFFGSAATNQLTGERLAKCQIGDYLGRPEELIKFVKQRYIWVSRITMGSRANSLGHLVQNYVAEYLKECFSGLDVSIQSNGTIPGVSHNDINSNRPTTFDIVVSKQGRFVAVEISFQVTTNSLIERKAGQAQARYNQINSSGHRIAYVLDGAGNFQRKNALGTICSFSHCNVAFSDSELEILRDFILEHVS